jgi:hypothetical protein
MLEEAGNSVADKKDQPLPKQPQVGERAKIEKIVRPDEARGQKPHPNPPQEGSRHIPTSPPSKPPASPPPRPKPQEPKPQEPKPKPQD